MPEPTKQTNATGTNITTPEAREAWRVALGLPKHNYDAVVDPTDSDNSVAGYQPGSKWFNKITKAAFILIDEVALVADWQTLAIEELGSAAFLDATTDGKANPTDVLKTDADGGVTVAKMTADKVTFAEAGSARAEVGDTSWQADKGTVATLIKDGVTHLHGQDLRSYVLNDSGDLISKGRHVMYDGIDTVSGYLKVKAWDGSDPMLYRGIAECDIADTETGYVATHGEIQDIQADGVNYGEVWADEDTIYAVTDAPYVTNIKPSSGGYTRVGVVALAHASTGIIKLDCLYVPTVDEIGAAYAPILSTTPPLDPVDKQLWIHEETGTHYTWWAAQGVWVADGIADGEVVQDSDYISVAAARSLLTKNATAPFVYGVTKDEWERSINIISTGTSTNNVTVNVNGSAEGFTMSAGGIERLSSDGGSLPLNHGGFAPGIVPKFYAVWACVSSVDPTPTPTGDISEFYANNIEASHIDLTKAPALTEINVSDNLLTSLDLSNAPDLFAMAAYNNFITYLDFSGVTGGDLAIITAYNNSITRVVGLENITTVTDATLIIELQDNELSAESIDNIFAQLPDRSVTLTGGDIDVSGNPGSGTCVPSIATAKGWTVVT